MNRIAALLAAALFALFATHAFAQEKTDTAPRVSLQTNVGEIVLELDLKRAPLSVANFLQYVREGQYNNTIFHRVIPGFMIQGGGYNVDFSRKETRDPIENEARNGLKNRRGTLAMARTADPHSGTAQFYINLVDNNFLDHRSPTPRGWGYAVFGHVIAGMDIVDRIASIQTGPGGPFPKDVPQQTVVIQQAQVLAAE